MVKTILTEQGDVAPLGKSWTQRFFKRHEIQIKLKTGRLVDIERIEAVTEAQYRAVVRSFTRDRGPLQHPRH